MDSFKQKQRTYLRRRKWQRIVGVLAMIVVFCTGYALMLPAITMENPAVCGLPEHTHTDNCYELRDPAPCTVPESQGHAHTDSCWETREALTCGLEQTDGHAHGEECWETVTVCTDATHGQTREIQQQNLICGLEETEEHSHGDGCRETVTVTEEVPHTGDCFTQQRNLICGLQETEGHTHGEDCVQILQELVCGLEESEGHSHSADSTEPVRELICQLEEHLHAEACYPDPDAEETTEAATEETTEATTEETTEETLPQGDPTADLESSAVWEASLSGAEVTGDLRTDLLDIARSQLGYEESRRNFIYDENNAVHACSRYGQWAGQPYGDWNGAFTAFCLHYAGMEDMETVATARQLLSRMQELQCAYAWGQQEIAAGDLIFLDRSGDGACDFVGIVEALLPEGTARSALYTLDGRGEAEEVLYTGEDGIVQVIAGNIRGRVDRVNLAAADPAVMGFASLPVEVEEDEIPLTAAFAHEAEDGSVTEVLFTAETGVPEDAQLKVTEITAEDESYSSMVSLIEETLEAAPQSVSLVDISFYDAEGEYLKVPDTAQVVMELDMGDTDPRGVKVFHFVDGVPVELETVDVYQTAASTMALRRDVEEPVLTHTQLTFETDGFSVFAIVVIEIDGTAVAENWETVTDVSALANNSYYIVDRNKRYVMADVAGEQGIGLGKDTYAGAASLPGMTVWTFVPTGNGTYYIVSDEGLYLWMEDAYGNNAGLGLKDTQAEATAFTLRAVSGQVEIGYDGPYGYAHYLNVYGGSQDFFGWYQSADQDAGSKVFLHKAETSDKPTPVTDLDGSTYAILSSVANKALGTAEATVNGVSGLQSVAVTTSQVDGETYYIGDAPLWLLEAAGDDGRYHISTQVGGATKYLRLLDAYYGGNTSESKGSLTLGDEPQDIYVGRNTDGTLCLWVEDGTGTGYINLDQSGVGNFWVYNQMAASNKLRFAEKEADVALLYDLNSPSGVSWINRPGGVPDVQNVTEEGTNLPAVTGANVAGTFVDNNLASRGTVTAYYNSYNAGKGPGEYKAPGGEYRFLGWRCTVAGQALNFPENAPAVRQEDGIHVTDADGVERVLPYNTTLYGRWEKVSDVVLFFVNFGATMLEGQDNKVISGYGSNFYTGVAAIAHIYNESTIQPDQNSANQDIISRYKDQMIQDEIAAAYDPTNPATQIVIDAVARINSTGTAFNFESVTDFNQNQLEASVAQYLRNDPDTSKQVKIDNAYVDKREITADNYKLYWYLQKEVDDDGWHIDGVLVAKTASMDILKTFSGLTAQEAEDAIGQMSFPLSLISASGTKSNYTTLTASSSQEGVYTNHGKQSDGNIYGWTLQTILGQRYAFEEAGYQVDGHDWSGLVSVHFTDKTVDYRYNTDSTFTDRDLYDGSLIGGQVESVIFANFYTKTGTGAFSVSKVADEAGRERLPGAEFTLTGVTDPGYRVSAVTNENGAVHFADLEPGTYTMEETRVPEGYRSTDKTWTVTVAESDSGAVTVTVKENGSSGEAATVYDSANGGIREVYLIRNFPEDTTVTVNTYFTNITQSEVKSLTDYRIRVCDSRGTVVSTLTLADASPITGATNGYTWTLKLDCDRQYSFVEENFLHDNYLDTVVAAEFNGVSAETARTDTDSDGADDTATVTVRKSESADTVNITNAYTNTFTLKICKVDATADRVPIQGVEFNIYGSFGESQGGGSLEYVDSDGNRKLAYLIGKTAPTDADGITWYYNMKLSQGSRTFIYVVDEVQTPAGYVELDEPIVRVVEVDGENYENGVYTLTVENYKRDLAEVTVSAFVEWNIPEDMERRPVTLSLYRKSSGTNAELLQEITLDGTDRQLRDSSTGITTTVTGWDVRWEGLTYAADTTRYEYYVAEAPMAGYHTAYSTEVSTLRVGTQQVAAAIAEGTNLKRSVTVINSTGYELPRTGGMGIGLFYILGSLMALGALLVVSRRTRIR